MKRDDIEPMEHCSHPLAQRFGDRSGNDGIRYECCENAAAPDQKGAGSRHSNLDARMGKKLAYVRWDVGRYTRRPTKLAEGWIADDEIKRLSLLP
jgi:hypothetical protein